VKGLRTTGTISNRKETRRRHVVHEEDMQKYNLLLSVVQSQPTHTLATRDQATGLHLLYLHINIYSS
jgi:hypothetical protein